MISVFSLMHVRLWTTLVLLGLFCCQVYGQLILTEEENLAWVNKLRDEKDLSVKLEIVRARILADTNVFIPWIGDRYLLKKEKDSNKEDGICKPLLVVEGVPIQLNNLTSRKTVENLAKKLTTDNIVQLETGNDQSAKLFFAYFGQNGLCGIIFIKAKNRKAKRSLLRSKA